MTTGNGEDVRCNMPAHGEMWARNSLARARKRGEEQVMFRCPFGEDHWHVADPNEVPDGA